MATCCSVSDGESHGQKSRRAIVHGVAKNQTRLTAHAQFGRQRYKNINKLRLKHSTPLTGMTWKLAAVSPWPPHPVGPGDWRSQVQALKTRSCPGSCTDPRGPKGCLGVFSVYPSEAEPVPRVFHKRLLRSCPSLPILLKAALFEVGYVVIT